MAHDAFISYSTRDKAVADAACAGLEAMGIRCWIAPRDVTPGAEWGQAIIEAINQSRVMVLIFSANANASPQIRREVERAVAKAIPILPLRIEDVAPAGSLEYFIGTVHWLDALTPPLESHLLRLGQTVKTLLQIDPAPPRIVQATEKLPERSPKSRSLAIAASLAMVAAALVALGAWKYFAAGPPPQPPEVAKLNPPAATPSATTTPTPAASPSPSPAASATPAATPSPTPTLAPTPTPVPAAITPQPVRSPVDPAIVGTFTHDGSVDGYDERITYTVSADGSYHLTTLLSEHGVYSSGGGKFRTTNSAGRVRTGSYRAVGDNEIEVVSATNTATFRPDQPSAPLNRANPAMLGVWRASATVNGLRWALTIDNSPDGAYRYEARWDDTGNCNYADQKWRATSAVTGLSSDGTYRVLDPADVEFTGPAGPAVWRKQ